MLKITKAKWGFEARIFGNAGDDVAAATAPTMKTAIEALRHAVDGLPAGKRRTAALSILNQPIYA